MFQWLNRRRRMEILRQKLAQRRPNQAWVLCTTLDDLALVPDGPCIYLIFKLNVALETFAAKVAIEAGIKNHQPSPAAIGNSAWKGKCPWRRRLESWIENSKPDDLAIAHVAPLPDATDEELDELCDWVASQYPHGFGLIQWGPP